MENRRATVFKDKFLKKFDEDDEGYTFLSIGGKLPRIKAPLPDGGGFEAEDCGDPSTIAPPPVVGKTKACGRTTTKEASGVGKALDCGRSSTVAGEADNNIFSNGDGSPYTKEELRTIKEFFSHLNAVGPFDIEMEPPICLHYPLHPVSLEKLEIIKEYQPEAFEQYFLEPAKFALKQINIEEGRDFEFDGLVKAVNTPLQHVYLTFAAKQEICKKMDMKYVWTYDRVIFQASVYTPYGKGCFDYELREWQRKADPAAAS